MDVFISWSGKTSGELAKVLRDWLPSVIQAAKPYFSTDDIEKGTRGNTILSKELEEASIGVLCLTRENLEAAWIMFEAGSLSKSLDKSRVCPILFGDLGTTDLKGPLTNFQAAKFNKGEMQKVLATINAQLGEDALSPKTLDTVFEKWWPELNEKVKKLLSSVPKETGEKIRSDRELLEEVLMLVRQKPEARRHILKDGSSYEVLMPEEYIEYTAFLIVNKSAQEAWNWLKKEVADRTSRDIIWDQAKNESEGIKRVLPDDA